jgi:hypothetical protein
MFFRLHKKKKSASGVPLRNPTSFTTVARCCTPSLLSQEDRSTSSLSNIPVCTSSLSGVKCSDTNFLDVFIITDKVKTKGDRKVGGVGVIKDVVKGNELKLRRLKPLTL